MDRFAQMVRKTNEWMGQNPKLKGMVDELRAFDEEFPEQRLKLKDYTSMWNDVASGHKLFWQRFVPEGISETTARDIEMSPYNFIMQAIISADLSKPDDIMRTFTDRVRAQLEADKEEKEKATQE